MRGAHLVELFDTLIPVYAAEDNARAMTWRGAILAQLMRDAFLEELARRGGPRTAREYSEREWARQALDPAIVEAAIAARAAHHSITPSAPVRAPRPRRRSLATLYAEGVRQLSEVA